MTVRPIIFLGPSLDVGSARAVLDADYRPPARRGDIHQAAREKPPLIGIIDGVFLATLPPSPLEVLQALATGTVILGASSLGALRAVELEPHGMVGVGRIFRMYRRRQLVADDEVALVFAPDDHRPLSEPLVNMRYALSLAGRAGLIQPRERRTRIRIAKQLYFPERSWPLLLDRAAGSIPATTRTRLADFVARGDFDLKRKDALQLLHVARGVLERRASEGSTSAADAP